MPSAIAEKPDVAASTREKDRGGKYRGGKYRGGKYLTFRLGREEFAFHVMKVREIMGIQEITAVPHMPLEVKDVINLRGKVAPVIDLRLKFGLPEMEYSERTCIIVVQVRAGERVTQTGIVVGEVSEVLNLAARDIEDMPNFGCGATMPYLLGMAKVKDKVKMLLDIDQILSPRIFTGSRKRCPCSSAKEKHYDNREKS